MKQIFESERIRFTEVSEELVQDYLAMINDPVNYGRFIGGTVRTYTAEQETRWVQRKLAEKTPVFSMIDKKSGGFIGNIELMNAKDAEAELGIGITAARQNAGYGTEAVAALTEYGFRQLGLDRIFLKTDPGNARAIRVYEKCGFREYDRTDGHVYMELRRQDAAGKKAERGTAGLRYLTLRECPELKNDAAEWFHGKWGVPAEAYLECMDSYLGGETENGWYLCTDGDRIVAGMGVIDNDFHDRKDLSPNVCAVYTEEEYRGRGIAGRLLDMAVEDLRAKGITPVYLVTDHTGFYERYGWEFLCMVQGDGEPEMTRMYIHR